MGRLHDPTVGPTDPTGRADRSDGPVGPTVGSCERSSDRSARPVGQIKQVKFIQPVGPTVASLKRSSNCRTDYRPDYANEVPQSANKIDAVAVAVVMLSRMNVSCLWIFGAIKYRILLKTSDVMRRNSWIPTKSSDCSWSTKFAIPLSVFRRCNHSRDQHCRLCWRRLLLRRFIKLL